MGGGCSAKRQFIIRAKCPGQDKRANQIFISKLQLHTGEIDQIFRAFCKIDQSQLFADIDIEDLVNYFEIPQNKLLNLVFHHLDDNDSNTFNFLDFVLTVRTHLNFLFASL